MRGPIPAQVLFEEPSLEDHGGLVHKGLDELGVLDSVVPGEYEGDRAEEHALRAGIGLREVRLCPV